MNNKPTLKPSLYRKRMFSMALTSALTLTAFPRQCFSQVIDPVTAARAPIPGAGHQYIGVGTETVNPADGTPSFSLPIQTPAGRQLAFPFGIRYNGAAPFYISGDGENPQFYWTTPILNGTPPPFDINGWSYALPNYVGQAFVQSESQVGPPGQSQFNYCWAGQNYSFSDLAGVERTLFVTNNWADVNNPTPNACTPSTYAGGGEDGVATSFGTPTTNIQPALAVTDKSGTVYQFPSGPSISTNPTVVGGGITAFGLLAQTITDKNGNQITLAGANDGFTLGAGGYTDTLGRSVVSWSGLGSSAGDQLTVSGLGSNIVVKWTKTTVTFPEKSTFLSGTQNGSTCGFSGAQSIPISVVSEIDLPAGQGQPDQKYSFLYGSQWGLLDRITFPGGGYVRYVWGTNPASQITYQRWTPQANDTEDCYALVDMPAITDRYVSYDGVSETLHQAFAYNNTKIVNNSSAPPYWSSKTTTVTNKDLAVPANSTITKYTYTPAPVVSGPNSASWQTFEVPVEQTVVYEDASGKTVQTNNKTWFNRFTMVGNQTVLSNGQSETTLRCPDSYDRILATYEYDFQSNGTTTSYPACGESPQGGTTLGYGLPTPIGPLLRQTVTAYHTFANTHILDEPDSVTVSKGSGSSKVKLTNYYYDAGTPKASGTKTGFFGPPGLRGNVTSVSQWLNTSNTYLTHTYAYWDTGQVYTATDPCATTSCPDDSGTSFTTTYAYGDSYAQGTGSPAGQTNAYLTQVTYPSTSVTLNESLTWGFNDGLLASHTDQNSVLTNYSYVDPLDRLTLADSAVGSLDAGNNSAASMTQYKYPSLTEVDVEQDQTATGDGVLKSSTFYDGLNHAIKTVARDGSVVQTAYDSFGRVCAVSNPTFTSPGPLSCVVGANKGTPPTDGYTYFSYDALGRKTLQTQPDNTTQRWVYSGNTVDFYDEDNSHWQWSSDALGRLTKTKESDPGGSGVLTLETDYTYDLLDNLLSANQIGGSGYTARYRTFVYDSLSRLTNACNPESVNPSLLPCTPTSGPWSAVYNYDADGNTTTRTDARGTVTHYTYDALNRLTGKTYTNDPANTPALSYGYDTEYPWQLVSNENHPKGHLNSIMATLGSTNLVTWTSNDYDQRGTLLGYANCLGANAQSCPGAYTTAAYGFNLIENPTAMGLIAGGATYNGQGEAIYPAYDPAGRVNSIATSVSVDASGNSLTSTAFSGLTYFPGGAVKTANLAIDPTTNIPGITLTRTYDYRGRITGETDENSQKQTAYKYSVSYDGNSNVTGYNDSVAGVWTVKNDALHRLSSSTGTINGVAASFQATYDPFGNRYVEYYTYKGVQNQPSPYLHFTAGNNRIDNGSYDNAGNLLSDGTNNYLYDAEGRLCATQQPALIGGGMIGYLYAPDGTRLGKGTISKTKPFTCDMTKNGMLTGNALALTTLYAVGPDGEQLEEVGTANNYNYSHFNVFWEGKLLGTYTGSTNAESNWHFALNDWLGTKRQITTSAGAPTTSFFSGPFGDYLSQGTDQTEQHFTGKERDTESGLDYFPARYFNSNMGRFMSPDWAITISPIPYGDISDPQSLNLYSYVRNNPLSRVDANGHVQLCGPSTSSTNRNGDVVVNANCTDLPDPPSFLQQMQRSFSQTATSLATVISRSMGSSGGPRAGRRFSPNDKQTVLRRNATQNGGSNACDNCGQPVVPGQRGQPGVTPPDNEANVDHIHPRSQGGDADPETNGQLLCRACNLEKTDSLPTTGEPIEPVAPVEPFIPVEPIGPIEPIIPF